MYFTEGPLLEFERMMKAEPRSKPLAALSSSNLPLVLNQDKSEKTAEKEVEDDECGQ